MTPPARERSGEGATAPLQRFDGELLARSLRFTLTVMAPVAAMLVTGPSPWLVFAMVAGIVAFAGDAGGMPLVRFGWMATGPLALCAGLLLGSLSLAHPLLVALFTMAAGFLYGMVETAHPHLLLATRFLAFGIVLAGLVVPPTAVDYAAIAVMLAFSWAVSLGFDAIRGRRTLSVPPAASLLPGVEGRMSERVAFGLAVAFAIGGALAISGEAGATHPSWACLTILMVMRSEIASSLRLSAERVVGTLGGVLVAAFIAHFGSEALMIAVMGVAAFIRWPAEQVHSTLGVFCLTLFVLLLVEIVTPDSRQAALLLQERFTDTLIGAVAAAGGLLLFPALRKTSAWLGTTGSDAP